MYLQLDVLWYIYVKYLSKGWNSALSAGNRLAERKKHFPLRTVIASTTTQLQGVNYPALDYPVRAVSALQQILYPGCQGYRNADTL